MRKNRKRNKVGCLWLCSKLPCRKNSYNLIVKTLGEKRKSISKLLKRKIMRAMNMMMKRAAVKRAHIEKPC